MNTIGEYIKDPAASLDYAITWADWLADGETIADATWEVATGLTDLDIASVSGAITTVWLSGGTAGTSYLATVTITTSESRVDSRTIRIICRQR